MSGVTTLRLTEELVKRIDSAIPWVAADPVLGSLTPEGPNRSTVIRLALVYGLDVIAEKAKAKRHPGSFYAFMATSEPEQSIAFSFIIHGEKAMDSKDVDFYLTTDEAEGLIRRLQETVAQCKANTGRG